jgi:hypothetical protein
MANPYIVGALHFAKPEQYYRSSHITADVLEGGNPLVRVTGARRIGKSWFLQWIEEMAHKERYVCVRDNLMNVPGMTAFVQRLWDKLPDSIRKSCPTAEQLAREGRLSKFLSTVSKVVEDKGRALALLLDEEESFGRWTQRDREVLSDAFFSHRGVRVVLAVSQSFSRNLKVVLGDPSWFLGELVEVSPTLAELQDSDADNLIRQTQSMRPVDVSDELCAQIRVLTNNQPYLLQLVCHRLYDETHHRLQSFEAHFGDDHFREIYQLANDSGFFAEALHKLTNMEKAVLLDIAIGDLGDPRWLPEDQHDAIAELRRFGYIRATESGSQVYAPAHGLWQQWLNAWGGEERKKLVPWPRSVLAPTPFEHFDLHVRSVSARKWEVTCLDSPAGQSNQPVSVSPKLTSQARKALNDLAGLRADQLRMDPRFFCKLGKELGNLLLPSSIKGPGSPRKLLLKSLNILRPKRRTTSPEPILRVRLRLPPGSTQAYPCEAAYCDDPGLGWCACNSRLSLVRFVPLPSSCQIPARTGPLRVLLAHSKEPPGVDPSNYRSEWETIKDAARAALDAGRVEIVAELANTTKANLRHHVARDRPHVVHLIAHGRPGIVQLDGPVTSTQLAKIFEGSSVRILVLVVCDSVQVGYAVAAVGVPAVVAMQGAPIDQFGPEFSRHFYATLCQGRSVDESMRDARARLAIWPSKGKGPDPAGWCVPVLYSRIPDGCV